MMPSRGAMRGASLFQLQCRHISSATRRMPQPQALRTPLRPAQWKASPISLPSIQAYRNASTSPTPPNPTAATPTPTPTPEALHPNMDTITLDNIDLSNPDVPAHIAAVPEKIGYLHEIGLSYHWGPTSTMQWVIEHIHIYTGLPWWGSICATAVLLRLAMFPLFIRSSDTMARSQAMLSVTQPLMKKFQDASKAGNTEEAARAQQELFAVRKAAGISFTKQLAPVVLQGMLGFGGFRALRNMAALPVPAFLNEGPGWLHDLTVPDPYLILPLAMAGTLHIIVRLGGETGAAPMKGGMKTFMLYVMPVFVLLGTGYQSAAVALWFTTGALLGALQSQLLLRPGVRYRLNMAPIYKPTEQESLGSMWTTYNDRQKQESAPIPSGARPSAGTRPMMYQSPTLRTSPSSNLKSSPVIDVPAKPSNNETQPSKGGVLQRASNAFNDIKQAGSNMYTQTTGKTLERMEQNKQQAEKKAAEAYEKRAQAMQKKGKGKGKRRPR